MIEALLGVALLGSLLVGLLVTAARAKAQAARAASRVQACRIADELLGQWWSQRDKLPRSGEGQVEGCPGWRWKTQLAGNESAERLDGQVVALELFGPDQSTTGPAVRVELLLPAKETR